MRFYNSFDSPRFRNKKDNLDKSKALPNIVKKASKINSKEKEY